MRRLSMLCLSAAVLSSCVTPYRAVRERTDPAHGAIVMALSFKGRDLPYWRRHLGEELFFSRLKPDGSLDAEIISANYRANDRIYALDLPAGRYAPVAAAYFTGRSRQLARFDEALSRKWAVDVRPGEIAFAGVAQLPRTAENWSGPAWNLLRRAASYLPPFKRAVIEVRFEGARLNNTPAAELETLQLARADLAGTFWAEPIAARLLALGNPPPVLTEGLIRKTPVPRRAAETFTYIDTLGWGPAQRVQGGLQWQAGKDPAWISIVFVPEAGEGGKRLDAIVRELREAGAPEDSHSLSEVVVSSRPALSGLFTTYVYPQASLVGSKVVVFKTRTILVPAAAGAYKAQFRAQAAAYERHRAQFENFLRYVDFAPPVKERT
jgi:hypothetical protein